MSFADAIPLILLLAALAGGVWGTRRYEVDLTNIGRIGVVCFGAVLFTAPIGLIAVNGPAALVLLCVAVAGMSAPLGALVADTYSRL